MRTAQDFINLTSKIQMDLASAQVKLTELRAWIVGLDLPTDEQPFSEQAARGLVENTAFWYPDASLRDELERRGATPELIENLLAEASAIRELGPPRVAS